MPLSQIMFSSATPEWATPQNFFDELDAEFSFDLDVCSTHENRKCINHYTLEEDGLSQKWSGNCWMNPPYGKEIAKWVKKAAESETLVVCLLPARTDTKWFHEHIYQKHEVRFIKGRLKFGGCKNSAPFPSMLVIMRPGAELDW